MASCESSSYSVGQISQLLSTTRKRKKTVDDNSDLQSLFTIDAREKPMFIQVKEKTKKKIKNDSKNEDSLEPTKKRNKNDNDTSIEEQDDKSLKYKRRTKLKEDPERLQRTIFVGNIPVSLKKKALEKLFDKYGEIESTRFRSAALAKPSMSRTVGMKRKEFHKDRQTLNGYVVFKSQSSAQDALQSNGQEVEGSHIRVDIASNDKVHNHSRSVFVGNLPFGTEEEPLREFFLECGDIESVRIVRDSKTGVGKGFGFVLFKSKDSVVFAIKLNKTDFKGRPIRVFPSSAHPNKGNQAKVKKGKPLTHSFSGLQAKKNIKVTKVKHKKRKDHSANKKKGGKKAGLPSKRSLAYKEKLNKKSKK